MLFDGGLVDGSEEVVVGQKLFDDGLESFFFCLEELQFGVEVGGDSAVDLLVENALGFQQVHFYYIENLSETSITSLQ